MLRFVAARRTYRPTLLFVALLTPVLSAATFMAAEITSFTVRPVDLSAGGSATGQVTVSGLNPLLSTLKDATVRLSSEAGVTVPASVVVTAKESSKSFSVTANPGFAGCPKISAQIGSATAQTERVYVKAAVTPPSSPLRLSLASIDMLGVPNTTTTGTVSLLVPTNNGTVQLASSNPLVTVPASISVQLSPNELNLWGGSKTFPVTLSSMVTVGTCSVITASAAGTQSRVLLKIRPFTQG